MKLFLSSRLVSWFVSYGVALPKILRPPLDVRRAGLKDDPNNIIH
jgi:hypothetical protein